jgi:poly(3-hydroxybutyrate) depolymerase
VLLVAPLSGHFATLLRETARTLLQDHDVYITDWHNARDVSCARRLWRWTTTSTT